MKGIASVRGWDFRSKTFATIGVANLFSLFYYRICIRNRQHYTHLDLDCNRNLGVLIMRQHIRQLLR